MDLDEIAGRAVDQLSVGAALLASFALVFTIAAIFALA